MLRAVRGPSWHKTDGRIFARVPRAISRQRSWRDDENTQTLLAVAALTTSGASSALQACGGSTDTSSVRDNSVGTGGDDGVTGGTGGVGAFASGGVRTGGWGFIGSVGGSPIGGTGGVVGTGGAGGITDGSGGGSGGIGASVVDAGEEGGLVVVHDGGFDSAVESRDANGSDGSTGDGG